MIEFLPEELVQQEDLNDSLVDDETVSYLQNKSEQNINQNIDYNQ